MHDRDEPVLVSVIMPAFRMGAFIGKALGSVADQEHTRWELIVVDDHGPEDGTGQLVNGFAARLPGHRVELIRHERNMGVSAARNTGIHAAQGELVAFLDPDDSWLPDHLSRLIGLFHRHKDLTVASGPVEIFSDDPRDPPPRVSALHEWQARRFPHSLALYNFLQPSASLVRREKLLLIGGFDTDPGIQHIEDYDLWIRLVEAGEKFAFLRSPTSRYRKHEAGATSDNARMRALDEALVRKHAGFFRRANASMLYTLMSEVHQLRSEMIGLQIERNGPIRRSIGFLDRLMRAAYRRVKPRDP